MEQAEAHKVEPMSFVPILAILAQLENVLGDSTVMFKPAKILEFFIHLKNLIKHVGEMVEAYIALVEAYGRVLHENAELKRKLLRHENVDTPPRVERESGTSGRRKQEYSDKPKKKQGGQPGHKGTTSVPEATHVCTAEFLEKCECGECDVKDIKRGKDFTHVGFKVLKEVTTYEPRSATCVGCGKEREGKFYHRRIKEKTAVPAPAVADPPVQEPVQERGESQETTTNTAQKTPVPQAPSDSDHRRREIKIPKFGMYEISVIMAVITFWDSRSVIRRIGFQLGILLGVDMGTGTVFNTLTRAAKLFSPETEKIIKELLKSSYLHIDETVVWINGKRRYVWIVATKTTVLYFPYTRHGKMLLSIFGHYKGIVISDGFAVYQHFKRRQRCWAHLLRRAKKMKKKLDTEYADNFYFKLKDILKKAKEKKAEGVGPEWYDAMNAELKQLLSYYSRYEELMPVINHIRNDPDVWFTFMRYSYVDPTNNWAEQQVREVVKQRIMRQALRTMEGAKTFTTLLSCMATWRLSGLDIQGQLEKYLSA